MYNRTVTNIENTVRAVHNCNSWFSYYFYQVVFKDITYVLYENFDKNRHDVYILDVIVKERNFRNTCAYVPNILFIL